MASWQAFEMVECIFPYTQASRLGNPVGRKRDLPALRMVSIPPSLRILPMPWPVGPKRRGTRPCRDGGRTICRRGTDASPAESSFS